MCMSKQKGHSTKHSQCPHVVSVTLSAAVHASAYTVVCNMSDNELTQCLTMISKFFLERKRKEKNDFPITVCFTTKVATKLCSI